MEAACFPPSLPQSSLCLMQQTEALGGKHHFGIRAVVGWHITEAFTQETWSCSTTTKPIAILQQARFVWSCALPLAALSARDPISIFIAEHYCLRR